MSPAGRTLSRRTFLQRTSSASAVLALACGLGLLRRMARAADNTARELSADVLICGAGLGGLAAALALCRHGHKVILTEETDWIGGQLTAQGVPPDEHQWIEEFGCTRTYRRLRDEIREYYRRHYPLTDAARSARNLNPGSGVVSRLCHEPRVAVAVLEAMLAPYLGMGRLTLLLEHQPVAAEVSGDLVSAISLRNLRSGRTLGVTARWFVDATELGDLLPMARIEHVTGAEGRAATGELHAPEKRDPANQQAFTWCFAMDYRAGEDHTIDRPAEYAFWRDYLPALNPPWPGKLLSLEYTHPRTGQPRKLGFSPKGDDTSPQLNLWIYRRIAAAGNFQPGTYASDISLVNWPQNDYLPGNLVGVSSEEFETHLRGSKQLSLSLLHWLQTEAPRPDGGTGWPGLRLRKDIFGTEDGLAKSPYIREARRIRALYTITEQDCGREMRASMWKENERFPVGEVYFDSIGIGHYPIDLHPSTGGDNYIDFDSLPFHIPLGALLPVRVENLLPACKNIGTTHVTNGCYRLHPVEWNIGEAVGELIAFASVRKEPPRAVRETPRLLSEFQAVLREQGIETHWPRTV